MPTPLTDAIQALTRYANETTGQSDTTLSDAVATLVEGYGQGGGEVEDAEIKNVNFLDYDARIAYSYTTQEFNELTELPSNVPHSGLVGEGWVGSSMTLDGIKTMLTNIPKRKIFVYPYYATDDGSTRVYLEFVAEQTVTFGFGINGTISIDWGDGTATSTLTGTNKSTKVTDNHTYLVGKYVMKISVVSGSFDFGGSSNNSWFMNVSGTGMNVNQAVRSAVKKIEIGANVGMHNGSSCFHNYRGLTAITRPRSWDSVVSYAFNGCTQLTAWPFNWTASNIVNGDGIRFYYGNAGSAGLNGAYYLQYVTLTDATEYISANALNSCGCLQELWIPSGVASIGASAFNNCYGMKEYHFMSTTPPTLANTNAFTGIQSTCVIYVPYSADHSILEAYQTANNWSTYASHIQEEPQG